MSDAWLSKISPQEEALKSRLLEALQAAECSSYLELNDEARDSLLQMHLDTLISVLQNDSTESFLEEIRTRASTRAEDPQFQLRHLVALFLLTRQVFGEIMQELLSPEEYPEALDKAGQLLDSAALMAIDAFASTRQAISIRQQSELAGLTEILREEMAGLDRSIAKTAANLDRLTEELRELQDYKITLVGRIDAIQGGRPTVR